MKAAQSRLGLIAAVAAAYAALDKISFIDQFSPLGITPWNPPAGLALAALMLGGRMAGLGVFLGGAAADVLVRDLAHPVLPSLLTAGLIALIYGATAHILRVNFKLTGAPSTLRHVFILLCAAVLASGAAALAYVEVYAFAEMIPPDRFLPAALRYWIGDMIGIAVTAPLILVLSKRPRLPVFGWRWVEPPAQAAALGFVLWLIFGIEETDEFRFFYLLFLPMIWIAARFGLFGAVIGNAGAQIGLILAFLWGGHNFTTVTAFQFLTLALTAATLVLGVTVAERRRVENELHSRRGELAQFARLSMAGELAAALAHEVNQPLAATIAFTRAAQKMMRNDPAKADDAIGRAVGEAQRAAEIIRSLREFIGRDRMRREPASAAQMAADAAILAAPECSRLNIRLTQSVDKGLPELHVDKVQIQQVLLNLLRNAMDSVSRCETMRRDVDVQARSVAAGVEFSVRDYGGGVSDEAAERLFAPFNTSKADGMGLGLSISRTLIEAHGGKLWWEPGESGGAVFRFVLPIDDV